MPHYYGRKPAHDRVSHPRLALGQYLRFDRLPPIPPTIDYLTDVRDWPMYLNDQIGDCTCAAAGHMIEAWTAYGRGAVMEIADQDVLKAYQAVSGYVPGQPDTDQGAVMQDVLNYWRKVGIGGHKIAAFAELDITNSAELDAALYLFGHIYIGLDVPASAEDQFDAGQDWDVVADDGGILGGHAVNLGARSLTKVQLVTWGQVQGMTGDFWRKYVKEAWVAISQEWINVAGVSPAALDTAALGNAYTELTGQPSPFTPTPTPTPGPTPDAADVALVHAIDAWSKEHHVGDNHRAAAAYKAWKIRKGL